MSTLAECLFAVLICLGAAALFGLLCAAVGYVADNWGVYKIIFGDIAMMIIILVTWVLMFGGMEWCFSYGHLGYGLILAVVSPFYVYIVWKKVRIFN